MSDQNDTLPVLSKVKVGSAAAGLVVAVAQLATGVFGEAGTALQEPVTMIVDALFTGLLASGAAFIGGWAKQETNAEVKPKR